MVDGWKTVARSDPGRRFCCRPNGASRVVAQRALGLLGDFQVTHRAGVLSRYPAALSGRRAAFEPEEGEAEKGVDRSGDREHWNVSRNRAVPDNVSPGRAVS